MSIIDYKLKDYGGCWRERCESETEKDATVDNDYGGSREGVLAGDDVIIYHAGLGPKN